MRSSPQVDDALAEALHQMQINVRRYNSAT